MKLSTKITRFKPIFGNLTHIKINEKIGEMNACIRLLQKKLSEAKDIESIKSKVELLEAEIVSLIDFAESQRK